MPRCSSPSAAPTPWPPGGNVTGLRVYAGEVFGKYVALAKFVTSGTAQAVSAAVEQIARFSEARRLPTMCDIAGLFFHTGGVLAYSVDIAELGARGASFVDRILRGANPAELPIEQPTRFQLIVNAKRAKALGIDVPAALLARADSVIQ